MFKASSLIRLKASAFKDSQAACLGKQLLQLLKFLEVVIPPHYWYAADIDSNTYTNFFQAFNSFKLKKIGDISLFKKEIEEVDQFLSGVFLAFLKELPDFESIEVETEDPEFRSLEIENIVIEIRAFDTSYFELYTDDVEIANIISDHFHVPVIVKA